MFLPLLFLLPNFRGVEETFSMFILLPTTVSKFFFSFFILPHIIHINVASEPNVCRVYFWYSCTFSIRSDFYLITIDMFDFHFNILTKNLYFYSSVTVGYFSKQCVIILLEISHFSFYSLAVISNSMDLCQRLIFHLCWPQSFLFLCTPIKSVFHWGQDLWMTISTCVHLQTPDWHLFILSVTSSFWPQSFTLHFFLACEKNQNLRILQPDRLSAWHSRFHPAAQQSSGEFKSLSEITEWSYRCGQTVTGGSWMEGELTEPAVNL